MKESRLIFRGGLFLSGAIIGVGIFALPYVVSRLGLLSGLASLVLFGLFCWLLNIAYAQVVLAGKENFQLGSYGGKYWGWPGELLGGLAVLVNIYGAMLAYLIGLGDFLRFLIPAGGSIFLVIGFWLIALRMTVLGLKVITRVESWVTLLLVFLIITFLIWGITEIDLSGFRIGNQYRYGNFIQLISVFFFAYAGFTVIPELGEIVRFNRKSLFRAVALGSFLPIVLYSLFAVISLGLLGNQASEEFVFSLGQLSFFWSRLVAIIAVLNIISSLFAFAFALREFWVRDIGLSRPVSLELTFLPPLLFYLLGFRDFMAVISFTGGVSCLLVVTVIFLCWLKEKFNKRDLLIEGKEFFVGEPGFEPGTSPSRTARASHLRHSPK